MVNKQLKINRHTFLRRAAAATVGAAAMPYIIPSSALGMAGSVAPSNRIVMGAVGFGMQGPGNLKNFMIEPDVQVVAICDIDLNHLSETKALVDEHYVNRDCDTYHDFRKLFARDDIDAVSLAIPDHWHAISAIAAAQAGKDIFAEKPLSHSLVEGRAMCDAVKRYGRVWQTGSWQRSLNNFRFGAELVLNGRIGKLHTVEVGLPSGHNDFAGTKDQKHLAPVPKELDYDMWLGPAPYAPYSPARVHKNWRWHLDYGGGQLLDWIGHHGDIAHWGMGVQYSGPYEIEGYGDYPEDGLWNAATRFRLTAKYANDVTMIIAGGHDDIRMGTKWIGDEGWVWVDRGDRIEAGPEGLLKVRFGPDETHLYRSPGHFRNFLDCVKSRATTIAPCEVAHRSATPGHLGQIAMLLGRKIRFNPGTEEIVDDPTATRMLGSTMRSPWHI